MDPPRPCSGQRPGWTPPPTRATHWTELRMDPPHGQTQDTGQDGPLTYQGHGRDRGQDGHPEATGRTEARMDPPPTRAMVGTEARMDPPRPR